ncbi:MAG: pimeloyl-ACP methyl ester esterase BioH [Sideroxydans sp.]
MHIEAIGSGPPLVLIHGWGMHGGVWSDVAQRLSADFSVHSVDLPGFGASAPLAKTDLDSLMQSLSEHFHDPVNVCGWSLGGQVAMHWAVREPTNVNKLVVVACTPCFTERTNWLFGLPGEVLQKFAAELEQNHAATLRRFISLQLRGSENERELLSKLREQLFSRGEPDMSALRGGLEILRDADQRPEVASIEQQTLVIAGQRDKLTPPEASHYLAQAIPNARLVEIEGAAHTPFLSHPDIFIEHVKSFLNE